MNAWLTFVFVFSSSAWAINPGEQLLIDDFLRANKTTTSPDAGTITGSELNDLKSSMDLLNAQASSINSQLASGQKMLNESEQRLRARSKLKGLYDAPRFREKLASELEELCCSFVKEPGVWQQRMDRMDKRWLEEVQKFYRDHPEHR